MTMKESRRFLTTSQNPFCAGTKKDDFVFGIQNDDSFRDGCQQMFIPGVGLTQLMQGMEQIRPRFLQGLDDQRYFPYLRWGRNGRFPIPRA